MSRAYRRSLEWVPIVKSRGITSSVTVDLSLIYLLYFLAISDWAKTISYFP